VDEEVQGLAASWLTDSGIAVVLARDGADAERRILADRIDLLVLDTLPTYLPGLPSIRKLKERRPLRVILIPRIDERTDAGVARISGVDAVLSRPLQKAALVSAAASPI
jgi:DNA-binding response OmpR family regulator